jgi:hypothetical protein
MALPVTKVEIAFDSGFATLEGARTWTDVSAYVEGTESIDITYGRADELSTPDPNQLTLTLDNRDGRFTPEKASSPYYPNVKKGKPIRVTVTYAAVDYIRFTGYINEWPLVWPDGSSAASTVTVTASSRRARMGQTAPLTSAIRAAYLETDPVAYWPMDENQINTAGQQIFRDVTNSVNIDNRAWGSIGSFYNTEAMKPVVHDGTQGPTDEQSLVRFPSRNTTDAFNAYVGAGSAISINSSAECTVELVARITGYDIDNTNIVYVMGIWSSDLLQGIEFVIASDGTGDAADTGGGQQMPYIDVDSGPTAFVFNDLAPLYDPDVYATATDGELHHYALTLSGGNTVKAYLDGELLQTGVLDAPHTYDRRFTVIAVGKMVYEATLWAGHLAVHDVALTDAEVLVHARAATAVSETDAERVERVAGRIGVPAAEIDVEASIAAPLGPQPEAGRSAAEVIDEAAASTAGIVYDTRPGHLAMQARNHRYNLASSFTLSATLQEVEGDLTAVMDDRYLVNSVEVTRAEEDAAPITVTDDDSIADHGVYAQTLTVVTTSNQEAEGAASNLLYRYAEPRVRVSNVAVDAVNLSDSQRALVLAADIGTRFAIGSLASQAPTDPMYLFLEGYSESISSTSHRIVMNTTPGDIFTNVAILDDAAHDALDSGITLGY